MVCTRDIRIKVTDLQYNIIRGRAQLGGYKTMSAFIRDTVLNVDYSVEKLVKEIHEMLVPKKKLPSKSDKKLLLHCVHETP